MGIKHETEKCLYSLVDAQETFDPVALRVALESAVRPEANRSDGP